MSFKVTDKITWVGKVDWELRTFHGEEYTTYHGSSYNSYLVRDVKTALIDTVWTPYANEFVENLRKEINLEDIDYIIALHGEPDHSGALPELMKLIPNTPIYCTANGEKSLRGQYHQDWNFKVFKTGDKLCLGSEELVFVEAPMLHWPDSSFAYLTESNVLFSNDAFGQHYATEARFNDLVDQCELEQECLKYYANILTPFSKLVTKKINEVLNLNLPVSMICTSHGVIWRENPTQIIEKYLKWANDYQENQITILYDTMWNATRKIAETIAEGIRMADPQVTVKLYNTARSDNTDVMTEIFKSKAILVGSSTINKGILSSIAATLEEARGLTFKNKKAAAFGSYGWSGESVKMISDKLAEAGFDVLDSGAKELWFPSVESLDRLINYGKQFADKVK